MLRKRPKPETVDLSSKCYIKYVYCILLHLSDSGITVLNRASPHTTDHVTELSLNHNELYTLEGISAYINLQKVGGNLQIVHVNKYFTTMSSCQFNIII